MYIFINSYLLQAKAEDLLSQAQESLLKSLTAESISCKMLHMMGKENYSSKQRIRLKIMVHLGRLFFC